MSGPPIQHFLNDTQQQRVEQTDHGPEYSVEEDLELVEDGAIK